MTVPSAKLRARLWRRELRFAQKWLALAREGGNLHADLTRRRARALEALRALRAEVRPIAIRG